MGQIALEPITGSSTSRRETVTLALSVALTSFSALLLELSLTRLFSVILFYHFAFLAISLALLGLGAGGVFAFMKRDLLARHGTCTLGLMSCGINSLSIITMLLVILRIPVSLQLDGGNALKLTAIYFCSAI